MEDKRNIKELAFVVPEDIKFEKDISELSDMQLQRWHDMMHVFFEKLLLGLGEFTQFRWSFNKTIIKHSQIVDEMMRRQIYHHTPINNLDLIIPGREIKSSVMELSEKEDIKISFNIPERVKKTDSKSINL